MNVAMNRPAQSASEAVRLALIGSAALMVTVVATPAAAQVYIDQVGPRPARDAGTARTLDGVTRNATEADAILSARRTLPAPRGPSSIVTQYGSGNQASSTVQPDLNRTQQSQTGERNISSITANGADNSVIFTQNGAGNSATTPSGIAGRGNDVLLQQRGDNNEAGVSIIGRRSQDNQVGVNQQGNGNQSNINVVGRENTVVHSQTGDNLSQTISRIGNGRTVTIQQFSLPK